jgi:hypothetical protein
MQQAAKALEGSRPTVYTSLHAAPCAASCRVGRLLGAQSLQTPRAFVFMQPGHQRGHARSLTITVPNVQRAAKNRAKQRRSATEAQGEVQRAYREQPRQPKEQPAEQTMAR